MARGQGHLPRNSYPGSRGPTPHRWRWVRRVLGAEGAGYPAARAGGLDGACRLDEG